MTNKLLVCTLLMAMTSGVLLAVEFDIDGATPGKWTMDLDAAKKVAAEKELPILLDFSGSDWCGWCKLMETNVFTKPEWKAYATNNLMMVLLDFPQDKSLVPDKYVERNTALNVQYGIEGFPTFVVLDDDGETELGRLSAGQEKTPKSFQAELKKLFSTRPAEMEKYMATLSPEDQAIFRELTDNLEKAKKELAQQMKLIADASEKAETIQESIEQLEEAAEVFRIGQLSEDKLKAYYELKAQLDASTKKLMDWIGTNPDRSDENMKLYQGMTSEIQSLEEQLSEF